MKPRASNATINQAERCRKLAGDDGAVMRCQALAGSDNMLGDAKRRASGDTSCGAWPSGSPQARQRTPVRKNAALAKWLADATIFCWTTPDGTSRGTETLARRQELVYIIKKKPEVKRCQEARISHGSERCWMARQGINFSATLMARNSAKKLLNQNYKIKSKLKFQQQSN